MAKVIYCCVTIPIRPPSPEKSSNLAFAFFLLGGQKRADIRTFYRFCRLVDDIADAPDISRQEKSDFLENWATAFATRNYSLLPSDLAELIQRRALDPELFLEIIRGVASDLSTIRYQTFTELREYCWRVASAVGLISIRIFECKAPQSHAYAEILGIALQLTNILRDVGEDAHLGRIYLPEEDLARFGVTRNALLQRKAEPGFTKLMRFEAQRARSFFSEARAALPSKDYMNLLPAEIMRSMYETLLTAMEKDGFKTLTRRYTLSHFQKLFCSAKVLLFPTRFTKICVLAPRPHR
ncbi:MAG: squalene synthase HpnD [Verrucomicrobia bacterium]|nr:MAG: squalene synthase HpnD [Verrucomicrobiota bacterium]